MYIYFARVVSMMYGAGCMRRCTKDVGVVFVGGVHTFTFECIYYTHRDICY